MAESSRLSSRLRELLRNSSTPGAAHDRVRPLDARDLPSEAAGETRYVPDEAVTVAAEAPTGCVIIERQYELDRPHGTQCVAHYAEAIDRCLPALAVLALDERAAAAPVARPRRLQFDSSRTLGDDRPRRQVPTRGPLLFFDLETTGLSGGAGTVAFLVGCGYFNADGFHTLQYFLAGYEAEHDLLLSLSALTGKFGGLVTFNGRTFDVPLIDGRYQFHRLSSPFGELPHFDMLHPARKLWRRRGESLSYGGLSASGGVDPSSCALGALEEAILGVTRVDDVPGAEIPSRYFHYLRTGDMEPLQAVFEHNRLDLISLAALTALGMRMVDGGPEAIGSPHEALAMGRMYEQLGRTPESEAHFRRAAGLGGTRGGDSASAGSLQAEALRQLALQHRRRHQHEAAAEAWRGVLDAGDDGGLAQEARRALAIHHEHRVRDFEKARAFAQQALDRERDQGEADALRHRLARLDRKLERRRQTWGA